MLSKTAQILWLYKAFAKFFFVWMIVCLTRIEWSHVGCHVCLITAVMKVCTTTYSTFISYSVICSFSFNSFHKYIASVILLSELFCENESNMTGSCFCCVFLLRPLYLRTFRIGLKHLQNSGLISSVNIFAWMVCVKRLWAFLEGNPENRHEITIYVYKTISYYVLFLVILKAKHR